MSGCIPEEGSASRPWASGGSLQAGPSSGAPGAALATLPLYDLGRRLNLSCSAPLSAQFLLSDVRHHHILMSSGRPLRAGPFLHALRGGLWGQPALSPPPGSLALLGADVS